MQLSFPTPNHTSARRHPANVQAGDMFNDTNRDGSTVQVITLRDAKRLPESGRYAIVGLNVTDGRVSRFVVDENATVNVTGWVSKLNIDIPLPIAVMDITDPMVTDRDSANEQLLADSTGDEPLLGGSNDEITEPE